MAIPIYTVLLYCVIHYNAGAGYKAWQQKPKWTCNFAWKSFFLGSILNSNFFVNPFSSDAYRPHNTLEPGKFKLRNVIGDLFAVDPGNLFIDPAR